MKLAPHLTAAAFAAALALAFAGNATVAMNKSEMKTEKDRIEAQYKSAKAACKGMNGNAKDVCMKEAKGAEKVAKAELEARDKGTPKAQEHLRKVQAAAAYEVAKEKCDDMKGKEKSACKKDAKSAKSTTTSSAKSDMTTTKAAPAK